MGQEGQSSRSGLANVAGSFERANSITTTSAPVLRWLCCHRRLSRKEGEMRHKRQRYQQGSLTNEERAKRTRCMGMAPLERRQGQAQTDYRYGRAVSYTVCCTLREVDSLRLNINAECVSNSQMTIKGLQNTTACSNWQRMQVRQLLRGQHTGIIWIPGIVPKWGDYSLGRVKAFAVETWLKSLSRTSNKGQDPQYLLGTIPTRDSVRLGRQQPHRSG